MTCDDDFKLVLVSDDPEKYIAKSIEHIRHSSCRNSREVVLICVHFPIPTNDEPFQKVNVSTKIYISKRSNTYLEIVLVVRSVRAEGLEIILSGSLLYWRRWYWSFAKQGNAHFINWRFQHVRSLTVHKTRSSISRKLFLFLITALICECLHHTYKNYKHDLLAVY